MEFEISAELVGIYLEDAREHLAVVDATLLRLEREGHDAEVAASLLGPLHTLKGNSGMMGFTAVKDYVHRLEEVLARTRDGALRLDAAALDRLLQGAAALRAAIESACAAGSEQRDLGSEKAALAELLERTQATAPAAPGAAPAPAATAAAPSAPVPAPTAPTLAAPTVPAPLEAPPVPVPAPVPPPSGSSGDAAASAAASAAAAAAARTRSSMVRVDFAKLDHLLNLVGELIVHRTKLNDLGRQVAALAPGPGPELLEAVHQVASVSTQLQETIMDVRMLPIRHVFERFPRLVRDLAHQQGKQVELVLQGEDTRVDKAVIDEIGEPLVHLIRNAVDHGIEATEVRIARGKSPTGTILLQAAQESNQVVITLVDDGGGIDADEVRRKARERGLLRADEMLSDREAIQLIFTEGFSTARTVTDVSGRGVGLDVVVQSMERLNGLIEAETMPGAGTKFTLQLPLTLAIITVLMVDVGGATYALPSGSVVESLRYRTADVVRMNGRDTLRVRDRIVPLLHLAGHFGVSRDAERAEGYAVIVGRGEKRLGLSVDRLLGQQDVVIKALDPVVAEAGVSVAGATILGDGRVVLILDTASLFESRRNRALRAMRAEA
jgi:two-component system chemotaxis sensor kinase CheA